MGLMKKLTSAVVASSLVLASVGTALAAPTTEQVDSAFGRLSTYKIASGRLQADGTVDPALGESITRAELVTVIVRAFGQDANAKLLQGAASFADVPAHEWYSGYVALAKNIAESKGMTIGYGTENFLPAQQVTAVETLAFAMKFLGVAPGTGANWAADTVAIALANGIITEAHATALLDAPNTPASRGLAFAIADAVFSTAKVGDKTVYTAYVDTEAPVLVVNQPAEPTVIAAKATITGSVSGAKALYRGTEQITPNADGTFSVEVDLAVGANDIVFTAIDEVGNTSEASYKVSRQAGAAANVAVTVASEIVAGSAVDMSIAVTDATGAPVEVAAEDVTVTVGGAIGTYADGKFTAATKVGAGTITVTVGELTGTADVKVIAGEMAGVNAAATVSPGKAVKLIAVDAHGNAVEGASFSESDAKAFIDGDEFTATAAGTYTVTATKDGKEVTGTIAVYGKADGLKIEGPTSIIGNGKTEIEVKVSVVDAGGHVVSDYDGKIQYVSTDSLSASDGSLKFAENGVATFKFKAGHDLVDSDVDIEFIWDQDDNGTIDDDEDDDADITAFTIAVEEQVATSLELKVDEYLPTDGYAKVTVNVLDQNGKPMADGIWNVDLKVNGPAFFADPADIDPDEDLEDELAAADTFEKLEFALEYDPDPAGTDYTVVYLVPEDEDEVGKVTVTASYEGLTNATATLTAAEPDDADTIKLVAVDEEVTVNDDDDDSYAEFTLTVVDEDGVPTKVDETTTVTIDFGDVKEALIWVDNNLDGDTEPTFVDDTVTEDEYELELPVGTSKVTLWVSYAKAGTLSATASAKGLTKSNTVSTAFVADDPMYVALAKPALDLLDDNGAETTLTAQLYDAFGNKAAESGYSVIFKTVDNKYDGIQLNGKEAKFTTQTDATGAASVPVKLARYVDVAHLTVADDDADDLDYGDKVEFDLTTGDGNLGGYGLAKVYDTTTITVSEVVAQTVTVTAVDAAGAALRNVRAGDDVELKVVVKNNYGKPYDITEFLYDEGATTLGDWFKVEASDSDAIGDLVLDDDEAEDGVYYISGITAKEVGSLSVTVSMAKSTDVKGTRSISVRAGDPAKIGLTEENVSISNKKETPITLQVLDENENLISRNDSEGYDVTIRITDLGEDEDFEIRDADGYRIAGNATNGYTVKIAKGYNSLRLNLITYGLSGDDYKITFEAAELDSVDSDLTVK